jgi:hypothetical protein
VEKANGMAPSKVDKPPRKIDDPIVRIISTVFWSYFHDAHSSVEARALHSPQLTL